MSDEMLPANMCPVSPGQMYAIDHARSANKNSPEKHREWHLKNPWPPKKKVRIPKELLEQVRDHFDAVLYWAVDDEDIPNETYKEALKVLNELEEYVPYA